MIAAMRALRDCVVIRAHSRHSIYARLARSGLAEQTAVRRGVADFKLTDLGKDLAETMFGGKK